MRPSTIRNISDYYRTPTVIYRIPRTHRRRLANKWLHRVERQRRIAEKRAADSVRWYQL